MEGGAEGVRACILERFYDPLQGSVLIDGVDLRSLHPHAVRNEMALVQQEPALWCVRGRGWCAL